MATILQDIKMQNLCFVLIAPFSSQCQVVGWDKFVLENKESSAFRHSSVNQKWLPRNAEHHPGMVNAEPRVEKSVVNA